jgi:hypothetical protein
VEATQATFTKAAQRNQRIEAAIAKLNAELAASDRQAELARLRDLIALNEALKQQEAQFKANCAKQRAVLRVRDWWALVGWASLAIPSPTTRPPAPHPPPLLVLSPPPSCCSCTQVVLVPRYRVRLGLDLSFMAGSHTQWGCVQHTYAHAWDVVCDVCSGCG